MSARDDAIAELIEELRTRLFRADGIVGTAASVALIGTGAPLSEAQASNLHQSLLVAQEIIDSVAGKMESGPFLQAADKRAGAVSPLPVSEDEEAQPPARRH